MKIQLKRSNVLVGSAAKEPSTGQMEYGELAVNYNETDPAIFIKDSNNRIIRIAGANNVADDGTTNVPSGTTPPTSPAPEAGNLWFNSGEGRLYVYYVDSDSAQWVDASPDSWDSTIVPDTDNPAEQPGTIDDRYVSKVSTTAQNMAGNLTLGSTKITLDASDGSATFASNNVEINGTGLVNSYRNTTLGTQNAVFQIGVNNSGTKTNIYSFKANGELKIGGDTSSSGSSNILLDGSDGSAEFKGPLAVDRTGSSNGCFAARLNGTQNATIYADGSATFAGDLICTSTSNSRSFIDGNGIYQSNTSGNNVITLLNDGSATFVGQVRADTRNSGGTALFAQNNTTASDTAPLRISNGVNAGGVGTGYLVTGRGPLDAEVFNISNNGSATFTDQIISGTATQRGSFKAFSTGNSGARCFLVQDPNNSSINYASINGDGGAEFALGDFAVTNEGQFGARLEIKRTDGSTALAISDLDGNTDIELKSGGSATFTGDVLAGSTFRTVDGLIQAIQDWPTGNAQPGTNTDARMLSMMSVTTGAMDNQSEVCSFWGGYIGDDDKNVNTCYIKAADGSAKFGGNVSTPGVVFGTPSGNVTSKTLDDYEEGTWTPVIADASTGGNTGTYDRSDSWYVKYGRQVTAFINLFIMDTTGMTPANTFWIRGLPYAAQQGNPPRFFPGAGGSMKIINQSSLGVPIMNTTGGTTTQCRISFIDNSDNLRNVLVQDLNSGLTQGLSDMFASITYQIS